MTQPLQPTNMVQEFIEQYTIEDINDSICAIWERKQGEWSPYIPSNMAVEDDSYALLADFFVYWQNAPATETRPESVVFLSGGWAINLEDLEEGEQIEKIRPSHHPKRLRTLLCMGATVGGVASLARIVQLDGTTTDQLEEKTARGPIIEAMDSVAFSVFGSEYSARLILRLANEKELMTASERESAVERVENLRKLVEDLEANN